MQDQHERTETMDDGYLIADNSADAYEQAKEIYKQAEKRYKQSKAKTASKVEEKQERILPEGIEWPRFEDGELVRFGDKVTEEVDQPALTVNSIEFQEPSVLLAVTLSGRTAGGDRAYINMQHGERVKRPSILARDGKPIKVGETLYADPTANGDGKGWYICELHPGKRYDIEAIPASCAMDQEHNEHLAKRLKSKWLTHEKPVWDSWERLASDVQQFPMSTREVLRRAKKLAGVE